MNAGLETRIIPALDKLQSRNQIWIATHGIELIGSVPMADIVALKRESGSAQPERFCNNSSKNDRVRILEAIGAKVGLQLASNRVVFLEGKDSYADKRIIDRLAGSHLPGVLFIASGSSKGVMGAGTRAGEIVAQASLDSAFFMVLDRDFRDDLGVTALETKLKNRAMVWGCHEVENLLLEPSILLKILQFNGVDAFRETAGPGITSTESAEDREKRLVKQVSDALLNAARTLEERFTAAWAAYRLYSRLNPVDSEEKEPKPTDEMKLLQSAAGILTRATAAYSEQNVREEIARARSSVQASYKDASWRVILPGKEILRVFQTKYLGGVDLDTLKDQIVSKMIETRFLPSEIQRLIDRIKNSNYVLTFTIGKKSE
jgi:hypothetical protein